MIFIFNRMKKILSKIQVFILALCSAITSILVILIIVFLFKEGISFFNQKPVEDGFVLAVNPINNFSSVSPEQCKAIFDQETTNWKQLGGNDVPIELANIDDIGALYSEDQIGADMEHLDSCYNDFVINHSGALVSIPKSALGEKFTGKTLAVEKNSASSFVQGREWFPTSKPVSLFGILPLITGTFLVSFGAIIFALPLGLACAIFMAEITTKRRRKIMKPLVELLAGIPSVVYGFFGLVVIVPLIQKLFYLDVGETALAGSIILGIMALPTIITISEDALRNVPNAMREASLAMGATKLQTIFRVVIPYAMNGITTAIVLGIGRALGETMAVLMVTGNAGNVTLNYLKPIRTIPATIAAELGEAPNGGIHYKALFALGCVLFLFTMSINLYINFVAKKRIKK
jgi:phosphate transport system permease protein